MISSTDTMAWRDDDLRTLPDRLFARRTGLSDVWAAGGGLTVERSDAQGGWASLAPSVWPDSARVAVALSFDSDHETPALRDGETRPGRLSQGEYGSRVGAPRILRLLEQPAIPATFFMPAVSALLH